VLAYPEDRILRSDKTAGHRDQHIQPTGTAALKTTPGEKDAAPGARPTPTSYRGT